MCETAWKVAARQSIEIEPMVCTVCLYVYMYIYMSFLFRYCDGMTVVNKREYFVFQTIYNHICKIVRANSKRGNYFYAKSYIGSAKRLYAYAEWLTSFFLLYVLLLQSRSVRKTKKPLSKTKEKENNAAEKMK